MATLEFPTRTDLSVYSFTVELENVVYGFNFRFNERGNHWHFDLLDADGEPIREGIKVVSNWALLRLLVQQGRPDGEIMAVNPTDDDDPDVENLGTDSVLAYLEGVTVG